jgi:small subunit ribosomal protein S16
MPLVIRLSKTGTKKKIKHRIVVTDDRSPRDGRFIEILGWWNPNTRPAAVEVDVAKAKTWIEKGARPSTTVLEILKKAGLK